MLAVLDEVGVERAVVLGLGIAPPLLFAATHPRRTEALVLFNTSARVRRADDYPEGAPNGPSPGVGAGGHIPRRSIRGLSVRRGTFDGGQ